MQPFDELAKLAAFLWGNLTGTAISMIGVAARQVNHPEGFLWRRVLLEAPFAVLVSVLAGALGAYLELDPPVTWGLCGAMAYLGPQFLDDWLRARSERKNASRKNG